MKYKSGFVNEAGPSFMKGGQETHNSPYDDNQKKIPEGAVILNISDDKKTIKETSNSMYVYF